MHVRTLINIFTFYLYVDRDVQRGRSHVQNEGKHSNT